MKTRFFFPPKSSPFILLLAIWPLSGSAADAPVETIEITATTLQQELVGKQKYYEENTAELYQLIDTVLLPSFDVEYSAKQVLGRQHWTSSNEEQRRRFIDAFYSFLVKTYAKAILNFDQDNMTVMQEAQYSKDRRKALVRTQILLDGGDSLLINYAMRENPDGWLIYDLRVDGVSYIQNYRSQFDAEITANGIDSVIERLEAEAAAADLANKSEGDEEAA